MTPRDSSVAASSTPDVVEEARALLAALRACDASAVVDGSQELRDEVVTSRAMSRMGWADVARTDAAVVQAWCGVVLAALRAGEGDVAGAAALLAVDTAARAPRLDVWGRLTAGMQTGTPDDGPAAPPWSAS